MFLAVILLVCGRKYNINREHKESYLSETLKIIWLGLKKIRCEGSARVGSHWLDRAKESLGGTYKDQRVEDVKSVLRIVPIFLTFILNWTIYGQVSVKRWILTEGSHSNDFSGRSNDSLQVDSDTVLLKGFLFKKLTATPDVTSLRPST